jgi:hypothetical protein
MVKKMHDFRLVHMLQKQKQGQTKGYVCLILPWILLSVKPILSCIMGRKRKKWEVFQIMEHASQRMPLFLKPPQIIKQQYFG